MSFLRVGQSLRLVPVLKFEDLLPIPTTEQKAAFPENMQRLADMLNAKTTQ